MPALITTALRNIGDVEALADEWDDLLAASSRPQIFCTYEWMRAWWEVFGDADRALLVVTVRRAGRLVGLCPLLIHQVRALGGARVRRLEFLGTGEGEADEVCSDFLDIVAEPGLEDLVCQEVWQYLTRKAVGEWDLATFGNTLPDSLIERYLPAMARGSDRVMASRPQSERFYVDLSGGSFQRWVEGLSKQRQKRIFYYRRRLEREGGLEERPVRTREDIPRFLDETARLNQLRRTLLGKASAFGSERFRRFQALCAPRLFDRGWLDGRLYYRQNRCVAALYNFVYADTIYYYQCGFDTRAFGNLSPGLVTLSQIIEWGFDSGKRRFDFLVGGGGYKEDYDCVAEPVHEVRLYNNTITGQLVRSARGVRDLLRQARDRVEAH